MVLLKDVKSTNDKGLLGITETGEEILLSEPYPNFVDGSINERTNEERDKIKNYFIQEIARKDSDHYYQIGRVWDTLIHAVVCYNKYSKRK